MNKTKGDFTLPGESGAEKLTLELAEKWGADTIRDSDGTELSEEILNAGYNIYSTLCIIRNVNDWAKQHKDMLQQNFMISIPKSAMGNTLKIDLLDGYFKEQFEVDGSSESLEYWQVFDRTTGEEISFDLWSYKDGVVTINNTTAFHNYTVNFLVFRIWEEISMYNHITNSWGHKEHLMAVEPRHREVRECLLEWLDNWCKSHPNTDTVRFTSLFYNFTWIWGDTDRMRDCYCDWASYDFSVNLIALKEFEKRFGYKMSSEDFINRGFHNATHNKPSSKYLDWIDFTSEFVADFGKQCVDLVHSYGKKAVVFYDDSWVGLEPYGKYFETIGFDGIIKCVFSAFEVRLCADVDSVGIHEIRLHPYLFPTGLGGLPTFSEGGNPTLDAKIYWSNVRRALLRKTVDRIGLGGYLTLTNPFPDFKDYIEELADEFREIKALHNDGKPVNAPIKVAVATAWGKIRSWSCSGHKHEHPELDLINIIESLAGLPVEVSFIALDEIGKSGVPKDVNVLINAGRAASAWSGDSCWNNADTVAKIKEFIYNGGAIIGVNESSAFDKGVTLLQLSDVYGVDIETGKRICCGRYNYNIEDSFITDSVDKIYFPANKNVFVNSPDAKVLAEIDNIPAIITNSYGNGKSVYFSGFEYNSQNARLLMRALLWATDNKSIEKEYLLDNANVDVAFFENSNKICFANASNCNQVAKYKDICVKLKPYEMKIMKL